MKFTHEKFRNTRFDMCTQDELAEKTGISVSIIKNMESGRKRVKRDDENLAIMCDVLNLNIDDFFTRSCKVISCFNNKGGVGKTSLVTNIATVLVSEFDKRVLIIDCDAQANVTQNFNMVMVKDYDTKNLYNAFVNQESIESYIVNTGYDGLDMVLGHSKVSLIEPMLPTLPYKEQRFKNIINDVKDSGEYDFILCDTSPVLSMFNNIILRSCDGIIIPFEPEPLSLGGIGNTLEYIDQIKEDEKLSPDRNKINVMGIVINKYDARTNITKAITEVVEKLYDKLLFKTKIPIDVSVKNSQSEKLPISINYSKSRVYEALTSLAEEIINGVKEI